MGKFRDEKQIIMEATFKVHTMDDLNVENLIEKDLAYMDIGSFCFVKDGKKIPFDFEATARVFQDDGRITYGNFDGFTVKIYDIDPYYADEYEKLGLSLEDITAEFLASPERIEEFTFRLCDDKDYQIPCVLELQDILFINERAKEFHVPKELLNEYNARMCTEELMLFNEEKMFLKDLSQDPENVLSDKTALVLLLNQANRKALSGVFSDDVFKEIQFYSDALLNFSDMGKEIYSVGLTSRGNIDYGEDPYMPVKGVPSMYFYAETVEDCQRRARRYIENFALGAGQWAGGLVHKGQEYIGLVSYNGRFWDTSDKYGSMETIKRTDLAKFNEDIRIYGKNPFFASQGSLDEKIEEALRNVQVEKGSQEKNKGEHGR